MSTLLNLRITRLGNIGRRRKKDPKDGMVLKKAPKEH